MNGFITEYTIKKKKERISTKLKDKYINFETVTYPFYDFALAFLRMRAEIDEKSNQNNH